MWRRRVRLFKHFLVAQGVAGAALAARKGADHTGTLQRARAGRSAYVNGERLLGHNDPGAEAVALLPEHL